MVHQKDPGPADRFTNLDHYGRSIKGVHLVSFGLNTPLLSSLLQDDAVIDAKLIVSCQSCAAMRRLRQQVVITRTKD